jgi:endogenous inhibitor of DNA gyrase (YacG/DUF329 family)
MSAADEAETQARVRRVKCAACGASAVWDGIPHRPFCSLTCRFVDLGDDVS